MRRRSLALPVLAIAAAVAAAGCGSAGALSPHLRLSTAAGNSHSAHPPSVSTSLTSPAASAGPTASSSPAAAKPLPFGQVSTRPASSAAPAAPPTTAPVAPSPPPPAVLTPGMSGPAVVQLQERLRFLKYYPGAVDGAFGSDTEEAVWAFQETQGLPVTGTVGPDTQAALADPVSPAVLVPGGASTRVEVNLADEVLVLYQGGQVSLVSHVSSGGGYYYCAPGGGCGYAVTPTGDYQTTTYMPGWVKVPLGEMYNPVFFIGTAFAIHGDTYVPLQPASHGCVRLPMDIAQFFYTMVTTPGTPVYVRN